MDERATTTLKVWGDFACFTRPDLKVERVSYPVMTPSAARGVLEAIFWKPEIRYEVREIGVISLGRQLAVLRNEIEARQGRTPVVIERARQQRTSVVLSDIAYVIRADLVVRPWATGPVYKYSDQVRRRIERGQYHHTPYLGTREFPANFGPANGEVIAPVDLDVGPMLFDLAFVEDEERVEMTFLRHGPDGPRQARGFSRALFFDARLVGGWLAPPAEKFQELYRLEAGDV